MGDIEQRAESESSPVSVCEDDDYHQARSTPEPDRLTFEFNSLKSRSLLELDGDTEVGSKEAFKKGDTAVVRTLFNAFRSSPELFGVGNSACDDFRSDRTNPPPLIRIALTRLRRTTKSIRLAYKFWSDLKSSPLLTPLTSFESNDFSHSSSSRGGAAAGGLVRDVRLHTNKPEYGKQAGVLMTCLAASIILAAYLNVVLRRGVSGCSPDVLQEFSESIPSKHCENIQLLHVYLPLLLRQVRFTLFHGPVN